MAEPAQPPHQPQETVDPSESAGKPIDPAGPNPPPPSSSSPATTLRPALRSALSTTDVTVRRLDTLLSTSAGQDSVLAAIGYSSHALHYLLASAAVAALRARLRLLLFQLARRKATASSSPSSFKPEDVPSQPSSSKPPLLALSSLLSETRYTLRLFGLLPLWTWGSATLRSPPADPVIRAVVLLQVFMNVVYQALENVAYLASKGILPKRLVDRWGGIDKWYLWSTRAWLGHVLLQFVKLGRERAIAKRRDEEERKRVKAGGGDEKAAATLQLSEEEREARRQEIRAWRKKLVNSICWAPLCLHWSVEKGIGIPDSLTGFISFLAGAWGLYDSWKATATSL